MMMKWLKPLGASMFILMLCLYPGEALKAASGSLFSWATDVAPALLPFMIAVPALTCPEVCSLLARVSAPFLRFMRLPVNSSGVLLIGLLSGSPAGAAALASVPPSDGDAPGAYLRAALMASGASPAFLLTGVAVTLLDSPDVGRILLQSQLSSVALCGLFFRYFGSGQPSGGLVSEKRQGAALSAMLTLMTIGGYMVLFSVLARLLTQLTHPSFEAPLLAVLELAGGCRALASLPYDHSLILPLISAATCFGGVSVYMQCMSFLKAVHVDPLEYAAGKLMQAAVAALMTFIQLERPWGKAEPQLIPVMCLLALAVVLMVMLLVQKKDRHGNLGEGSSLPSA